MTPEDAVTQLSNEKIYNHTKIQLCGIALSGEKVPQNIIQLRDKIK